MWRPAPEAAAAASPGTAWWTTSGTSTFSTHTHRESEWLSVLQGGYIYYPLSKYFLNFKDSINIFLKKLRSDAMRHL